MTQVAKIIGTGLATTELIGAGVGLVFRKVILWFANNFSLEVLCCVPPSPLACTSTPIKSCFDCTVSMAVAQNLFINMSEFFFHQCLGAIGRGILDLAVTNDYFFFGAIINSAMPYAVELGANYSHIFAVVSNHYIANAILNNGMNALGPEFIHSIYRTGYAVLGSYTSNGIDMPWLIGSLMEIGQSDLGSRLAGFSR